MTTTKHRIAVIGSEGYVGNAHVKFFERRFDVVKNDIDLAVNTTVSEVNACDLAVVCVPTSMSKDGSCDTSIIEEVLGWLQTPLILIKSTIPLGYVRDVAQSRPKLANRLVFSPEYIGESKYYTGYGFETSVVATPWFIFGDTIPTHKAARTIRDHFYLPITGPNKQYFVTDSTTAELAKYMENCYFATKVTFANEMKRIADVIGVDYGEAREMWAADPRVDRMHTAVFPGEPGFGGKCLPKDLTALIAASNEAGYTPKFLQAVHDCNEHFQIT